MSDPGVTAYLTKLLCSHGGRLERDRLGVFLDLPDEQIEQILQEESIRFPQYPSTGSQLVLAQSPLRICTRYINQNDPEGKEEEETCPKLHLCRYYLRGKCRRCRYSHDVHSDHNRAVLKANELSGLNEAEIKVLLFQNDNQLLPEDCVKYIHGKCDNEEDCKRLHMCRFFTGEGCNRRFCKRSHNLLESKIILNADWLSQETVQNFQMLALLKHEKRLQGLPQGRNNMEAGEAQQPGRGKGRGRGRGRGRTRGRGRSRGGCQDPLNGKKKEKNDGPAIPNRPASQCSSGQRSGDEEYDDSDSDANSTYSEKNDHPVTLPFHSNLPSLLDFKIGYPAAGMTRYYPRAHNQYYPAAGRLTNVPGRPSTLPVNPSMGASPRIETRPHPENASKTSAASNISSPANIHPISTSKPSPYSTGESSNATRRSGNTYSPPGAESTKVPVTPTTKPTPTMVTKGATISNANIVSPKPAAFISDNLSSTRPSIPDQNSTVESRKTESSTVPRTANNIAISSSASITSSHISREDLFTVHLKPDTSTSTVPVYSSVSASYTLRSPSGSSRADTTSNKPFATVEPMTKPEVVNNSQYAAAGNENNAFNHPLKSTNSTAPQPQPRTNVTSTADMKVSVDKTPEICLSNIWKFCNFGGRCNDMHYYLPYRWQEFNGRDWADLPNMEEIEKAYSDPNILRYQSIIFQTMKLGTRQVRRLTTPSSVTRPIEYVLTTEWIWYWKDEFGTWTKYGGLNTKKVSSSIDSSDLENIYLSDPTGSMLFSAGGQNYIINFREMRQRNTHYQTEKEVCRRPTFLDFEKVKMLKGSTKSSGASSTLKSSNSNLNTTNYPSHWDMKAMPETGYQKVAVLENSAEFTNIVKMFSKTVSGHVVKKLWRVQNPSLWQIFQWQKDQMKKKNSGISVNERLLFHGTDRSNIDAICRENFDWRVCGTNGTVYGQGSYFARDASYSHNYTATTPVVTRTMFVARVLVGDFVVGNTNMRRPPQKHHGTQSYDSCVDNVRDPTIFVVFEKLQIYPEYILEYQEEEKKSSCVLS